MWSRVCGVWGGGGGGWVELTNNFGGDDGEINVIFEPRDRRNDLVALKRKRGCVDEVENGMNDKTAQTRAASRQRPHGAGVTRYIWEQLALALSQRVQVHPFGWGWGWGWGWGRRS